MFIFVYDRNSLLYTSEQISYYVILLLYALLHCMHPSDIRLCMTQRFKIQTRAVPNRGLTLFGRIRIRIVTKKQ